ncbi:MAG: DUF5077 domain-containing protein, partial [Prevotellaceae bacterium]|nr:DUF5077 domain-containing protein [Prevotellaceae bacterium]
MKRIFLLITLMGFFACNEPILKPDSVIAIPLGGNTYITEGADQTRRKRTVKDEGIRGWSDSSDVYSVYFRTSSTGKLNLFLT